MLLKIKLHSLVSKIFSLFSTPNHTTGQAEFQEFTPIISSGSRRIRNLIFIIFCFIFSLFSYPNYANATSEYEVVFSEVAWMGSSISTSDEWIELKNTTSQNINLSGWQITHLKQNSETGLWEEKLMLTIPSGVIPAGGYFLISNSEKDHQYSGGESILNIDPDLVDSSISLSNDKLQLKLYDGKWDDGRNPIDIAGNGGDPDDFAGNNDPEKGPKASMYRVNTTNDGSIKTNWDTTSQTDRRERNKLGIDTLDSEQGSDSEPNPDLKFFINLATPDSSGKPKIISTTFSPSSLDKSQITNVVISTEISDPDGLSDIKSVKVDLSSINGQTNQIMYDDGTNGDQVASDGIYSFTFVSSINYNCGLKSFTIAVKDQKDLTDSQDVNLDIYQLSDQIIINEIMPWPSSGSTDEFIELYNRGSVTVNLYKWQIDDKEGGSSSYKISENIIISPGGYLVFKQSETGIALNNSDSDQARLIRPDGQIAYQTSFYDKATKDQSYNLDTSNSWQWSTTTTPGADNIITQLEVNEESNDPEESDELTLPIPISQVRNHQEGQKVVIEGVVTVLPGTLSNRYLYIQDDSGGIQVYSYYERFPNNLGLGDWVRVTGELSLTTSGKRIKTDSQSDIIILKLGQTAYQWELSTGQARSGYEGQLVKVKGEVKKIDGNKIYINDGTGELTTYISDNTKINTAGISIGNEIEVVGIMTIYKGENQLKPRFQSDISIVKLAKSVLDNSKSQSDIVTVQEKWYDVFIDRAYATEVELSSVQDQGEVLGAKINKLASDDESKYINQKTKNMRQSIQFTESFILLTFVILLLLIGEFLWSKRLFR